MVTRSNEMEIPPPQIALLQPGVDVDQVGMPSFPVSNGGVHNHLPPILPSKAESSSPNANGPCPSLFDPQTLCQALHPEFLFRDGHYAWFPTTWICHAYQRRSDSSFGQETCHQHQCPLLHRPGWHHPELASFRFWRLHTPEAGWCSVWTPDPDINGQIPFAKMDHADMLLCLQSQPFVTIQDHARFGWKISVPAPLTYAEGHESLGQPIAVREDRLNAQDP